MNNRTVTIQVADIELKCNKNGVNLMNLHVHLFWEGLFLLKKKVKDK